jgi:signal transduction histidine kinase
MKLYKLLSGTQLLKNYSTKFMLPTFVGIHIPLFGIIGLIIFTEGSVINKMPVFLLTLGLTLLATAVTLYTLNALVLPLKKAQRSLADYLDKQTVTNLPIEYNDEVGLLMRDINTVTGSLHANLNEKGQVVKALSHDLRAPATNILALTRLLKEEKDADEMIRYAQSIEESVNKQLKLMDTMVYSYGDKIHAFPHHKA